jgi:hypothetical protein
MYNIYGDYIVMPVDEQIEELHAVRNLTDKIIMLYT